mgnify:CR=1 FL=1
MRWLSNLWWRLIRFGFRLLYNELAFTYDWVSKIVSLGDWRCWQRAALDFLPDAAFVLELAHGTGDIQLDLHAAGYRTIGFDLSTAMGRIASRKMRKHDVVPRLVQGRAQKLPFAEAAFDAIVCTFPTPFMMQSETLTEANRVLKAGGVLIVVTNGQLERSSLIRRFLEWLYRITGQREITADVDNLRVEVVGHLRQYGFDAHWEKKPCRRSFADLIFAEKLV